MIQIIRLGSAANWQNVVKYLQMKFAALILIMHLSASALAGDSVVVSSLPEVVRPRAEVETNMVFSAGAPSDNLWRLSVELDASVSNCVEVVLGCDKDEDGILAIDEGGMSIGWDCGEWFWRDRRGGGVGRIAAAEGSRRLDWTLRLNADKSARSVNGNVFTGAVAPTCFGADWNMIRVVSRGAEMLHVDSKMTADALRLRIR